MSLKLRRFLYLIFIIAFLVITPTIILYAAGYKLSKTGKNFQKTGMFILDTRPRGAKIFIDGKVQQSFLEKIFLNEESYITTPAKIKNLLPGEYDLKLELDGYWSWQKKLSIYSGASTFAEDINIFKKDLPVLLLSSKINKLELSPKKDKLAILTPAQLILLDLTSEEQKTATTSLPNQQNISWSSDEAKILADDFIFDSANLNKKMNLSKLLGADITNLKINTDKLYYQKKNDLSYLDLSNNLSKKIIEGEHIKDYLIKDSYAYLISYLKNSVSLNIFKIDSGQLIRTINLPNSTSYHLINSDHQLLNIYDEEHQTLYLVEPLSTFPYPLKKTINNIKYSHWVNDYKLLYANDFEIWFFDLNSNKKTLVTRISDNIQSIIWHPSNNYIIFSTMQSINTIELDEREKRNIIELVKFDTISSPVIDQSGKILYFYAKIGNQEGLYKLAI